MQHIAFEMDIIDAYECDAIIEVEGTFSGEHYNQTYDDPESRMEFTPTRWRVVQGMQDAVPDDIEKQIHAYVNENYYDLAEV